MKNLIVLYLLAGTSTIQFVNAEEKIRLNQLQNNSNLTFEINGRGSKNQKAMMKLVNKTNHLIKLIISAGDMLITPSKEVQNLIITKSETIELAPNASFSNPLFALCAEKNDNSPNESSEYFPGNPAEGNLLAMAQDLDQNKVYDDDVAQQAIWCISDHASFGNISHQNKKIELEIQKMVANHQGLDLKKELAKRKPKTIPKTITRGIPIERKRITSFHGNISFNLEKDAKVNLVLLDPNGNTVATFIKEENLSAGIHKKDFAYTDANIQYGLYQLIVIADGKEKLRRRVQLK